MTSYSDPSTTTGADAAALTDTPDEALRRSLGVGRRRFLSTCTAVAGAVAAPSSAPPRPWRTAETTGTGTTTAAARCSSRRTSAASSSTPSVTPPPATRSPVTCRPASVRCSSSSPGTATARSSSWLQPARERARRREPGVGRGRPAAALLARRVRAARPGQPRIHPVVLAADRRRHGHLQEAPGDRQHPRHGPHGHRRRPHRQFLPRRLGRGRRQVERARRDRPPRGHQALHPQPRQRVRLPARPGPAGRPGGRPAAPASGSWSTS